MNTISLLPPSIKTLNNKSYRSKFLLIVVMCLTIAMIISSIIAAIRTIATNNSLQSLKAQKSTVEAYIEANNGVLAAQDEIIQLEGLIEKAMVKAPDWSELLIEVAECRPNGTAIDIVKGSYGDTGTVVTINGRTNSQQSLKIYIDELGDLTDINEVKLNFARQSISQQTTQLEFEVLVYLQQEYQYEIDDR